VTQKNESALLQIRRRLLRRSHYRKVFCDDKGNVKPEAQTVMADLMRICRYNETALVVTNGVTDVPGTMAVEGMRSIVYRIIQMCRMDDSDLVEAEKNLRKTESNMTGDFNNG
jgi:hypothetical protein